MIRKSKISLGILVTLSLSLLGSPALAAVGPATASEYTLSNYDTDMVELVNRTRAAYGLGKVELYSPAKAKTVENSYVLSHKVRENRDNFAHQNTEVSDAASVGCHGVGENIFYEVKNDYRVGKRFPEASYSLGRYMASPGHRANILNPKFKYMASGTTFDPVSGHLFNTQRFFFECSPTKAIDQQAVRSTSDTLDAVVIGNIEGKGKVKITQSGRTWAIEGGPSLSFGRPGDQAILGNWGLGSQYDGIGVRRGNIFYLNKGFTGGIADKSVAYGRVNDQAYVGDFNGNGVDTPVVRRGNTYYFNNAWKSGVADIVTAYGKPTDEVYFGDFDGDGTDTPMVRRGNVFYISNSFRGGVADEVITKGSANDLVAVGDLDGDGKDEIHLVPRN